MTKNLPANADGGVIARMETEARDLLATRSAPLRQLSATGACGIMSEPWAFLAIPVIASSPITC